MYESWEVHQRLRCLDPQVSGWRLVLGYTVYGWRNRELRAGVVSMSIALFGGFLAYIQVSFLQPIPRSHRYISHLLTPGNGNFVTPVYHMDLYPVLP